MFHFLILFGSFNGVKMLECRGKGREKSYLRLLCLILCMKSISYCLLSPTPAMPGESSVPKLLTICKLGNSPLTSGSNCRVQGSPMTTLRFNNLLGHIELTESCYTQSMVYFSKRMLIKISQRKRYMRQSSGGFQMLSFQFSSQWSHGKR